MSSLSDTKKAIIQSRLLLNNPEYFSFDEYSAAYFATTENIDSYLSREPFNKNRALSVLASGDQVFSLIHSGVKEIDAFDINRLTYYVYHLKRAMLKGLPYDIYLKTCYLFCFLSYFDEVKEIINKLKSYMPEDVYAYYRELLEVIEKENRELDTLYYGSREIDLDIVNSYLKDEDAYLDCRSKLDETDVTLYFGDARVISGMVPGNYDIILLSNIADYLGNNHNPLTLEKFRRYINSFFRLLNKDGLLINYLFSADEKFVICDSLITKDDLGRENLGLFIDGKGNLCDEGYFRIRKK